MLSSEVSVLGSDIFELSRDWVFDLNIAGEVLVPIDLGEVAEGLVRDFGNVKLVIANSQQVVIDIVPNGI